MDLEEKVFKEILDESGYTDKMKHVLTDLYMRAYHDGRHAERKRLVKDGFVIIDPDKVKDLEWQAQDPCENCVNRAQWLLIGCSANPKECELKQKQIRAIEIITHFPKKK